MRVKISKAGPPIVEEIEVDFPLYVGSHHIDDYNATRETQVRIEADGRCTEITRQTADWGRNPTWEFEVTKVSVVDGLDHYLGVSYSRSTAEQFTALLKGLDDAVTAVA